MKFVSEESPKVTSVLFAREAREKLYAGLKVTADAVGCTMGPKGKCVIIQRSGSTPIVTKDGVTVSKAVNLSDSAMKMGAELIREAASRTNDVAGDGTTTATVLTELMVKHGLKLLTAGYDSNELRRGLEKATTTVIQSLRDVARPVSTRDEVAQVGTISANGDANIGSLIADAMEKVGREGIIVVEDAKGMQTTLDVVEGMRFDRGYLSPYFVTNQEKMCAVYENACVLITDRKLTTLKELVPVLEAVKRSGRGLLIIADEVEGEAMQGLLLNRTMGQLPVVAIKAPGYGVHRDAVLQDIATLAGATYLNAASGVSLANANMSHLGQLKKVVVDSKTTTIVASGKTAVDVSERISTLRSQLEDVTLSPEEVEILRTRVARLSSGVAVIRVGGTTELEMVERKYRIEDALNATRAAVEEGIVPGGGVTLLKCARALDAIVGALTEGEKAGVEVIKRACEGPLRQIVTNAGVSPDVVLSHLDSVELPIGYNAATDQYVDMVNAGVIDPAKVERVALENAASVAATFLSLDAVILEEDKSSETR